MFKKSLGMMTRVASIIVRALARQSKKLAVKFFANTRVRLMCMAYARHAESIMLSSIVLAIIGLIGYLLLIASSADHGMHMSEMEIILKSLAVFGGLVLPAVPAIIILDKFELYKSRMKSATNNI